MKKILFTFGIALLCLTAKAQTPYYYYYGGEKQYFSLNTEYAFLSLKEQQLPVDIQQRNDIKTMEFSSDSIDRKHFFIKKHCKYQKISYIFAK